MKASFVCCAASDVKKRKTIAIAIDKYARIFVYISTFFHFAYSDIRWNRIFPPQMYHMLIVTLNDIGKKTPAMPYL